MAVDVFHDKTSSVPMDKDGTNSTIVRIGFQKSDIGARKSHLAVAAKTKSGYSIKHVKGS